VLQYFFIFSCPDNPLSLSLSIPPSPHPPFTPNPPFLPVISDIHQVDNPQPSSPLATKSGQRGAQPSVGEEKKRFSQWEPPNPPKLSPSFSSSFCPSLRSLGSRELSKPLPLQMGFQLGISCIITRCRHERYRSNFDHKCLLIL